MKATAEHNGKAERTVNTAASPLPCAVLFEQSLLVTVTISANKRIPRLSLQTLVASTASSCPPSSIPNAIALTSKSKLSNQALPSIDELFQFRT